MTLPISHNAATAHRHDVYHLALLVIRRPPLLPLCGLSPVVGVHSLLPVDTYCMPRMRLSGRSACMMPVAREEPTHAALVGSPGLCDVLHPVPQRYHTDNIGGTSTRGLRPA